MPHGLSLVAGGGDAVRKEPARQRRRAAPSLPALPGVAAPFALPGAGSAQLAELFAASPRDAGWAGFLLPQLDPGKSWLWVQDRMAILESGRVHPPGLGSAADGLIHVEARDAREVLWTMEEGLRCPGLSTVVGEVWGDPASLDFTATRRLAVASERHGVAAYLIRLGGHSGLSGARMRWRLASAPSLAHPFNPRAPGAAAWDAELFRARGRPPGHWRLAHDDGPAAAPAFHLVAPPLDRALGEERRAG